MTLLKNYVWIPITVIGYYIHMNTYVGYSSSAVSVTEFHTEFFNGVIVFLMLMKIDDTVEKLCNIKNVVLHFPFSVLYGFFDKVYNW